MLSRWNFYVGLVFLAASLIGLFSCSLWWEQYYFAFAWIGWVFFVDALGFGRWKQSLFSRLGYRVLGLFILSVPFWLIYSWLNLHLQLWTVSQFCFSFEAEFFYGLAHSSVLPAIMVTVQFFLPNVAPFVPDRPLGRVALIGWVALGIVSFFLTIASTRACFPLIFCFLALILDPINYYAARPSLLFAFCRGRILELLLFSLAALIVGLFWESLNGITGGGWNYTLPYLNFDHLFAMPILGLLGYIPFGASAFAFVIWFESLWQEKPLFVR